MSHEIPAEIQALPEPFHRLYLDLPVIVTREEIFAKAPVYRPRTMANLDSQGKGPAGKLTLGSKVCYPREQIVLWLAAQIRK